MLLKWCCSLCLTSLMGPHHAHQVHIVLLPRLESKDSEIKLPTFTQMLVAKARLESKHTNSISCCYTFNNLSQLSKARENYFLFYSLMVLLSGFNSRQSIEPPRDAKHPRSSMVWLPHRQICIPGGQPEAAWCSQWLGRGRNFPCLLRYLGTLILQEATVKDVSPVLEPNGLARE